MIKPKSVVAVGELWHEEAIRIIDHSNIICIFGMSMGKTDTIWFGKIVQWLLADDNRQVVLYWHTDDPSDHRSTWKYLSNVRKARDKLTSFSTVSNEQKTMLDSRIHVVENTQNVLHIKLKEKKPDK